MAILLLESSTVHFRKVLFSNKYLEKILLRVNKTGNQKKIKIAVIIIMLKLYFKVSIGIENLIFSSALLKLLNKGALNLN